MLCSGSSQTFNHGDGKKLAARDDIKVSGIARSSFLLCICSESLPIKHLGRFVDTSAHQEASTLSFNGVCKTNFVWFHDYVGVTLPGRRQRPMQLIPCFHAHANHGHTGTDHGLQWWASNDTVAGQMKEFTPAASGQRLQPSAHVCRLLHVRTNMAALTFMPLTSPTCCHPSN